jgi:hypothetical protein
LTTAERPITGKHWGKEKKRKDANRHKRKYTKTTIL